MTHYYDNPGSNPKLDIISWVILIALALMATGIMMSAIYNHGGPY